MKFTLTIFQLATTRRPKEHEYSQAVKPVNIPKNRIQEMLPIDMKRVLLPVKPGVDGSDYINASYLQVSLHSLIHL